MSTVRAAVMRGADDLSVEPVEMLPFGRRDVVVRTQASGVCHSDLAFLKSDRADGAPIVLGHEGSGIVEEVGPAVTTLAPGDRVIATWAQSCGACRTCLNGQSFLCETWAATAPAARWQRAEGLDAVTMGGLGTFADLMVADERAFVKVDGDLPFEQLALIGCGVTTGVAAVLRAARVRPGATVAVAGCGGVGQAVVQGARIAGASRIIAVDPVAMKRDAALGLGATDAVDPAAADPVEQVRDLTGGRGADYAFDVVGAEAVLGQAYAMTRRGGTVVIVGAHPPGSSIPWGPADQMGSSKTVIGALYGHADVRRDFGAIVEFAMRGQLDLESMVSRRVGLDDVVGALAALERGEVLRSVVTF